MMAFLREAHFFSFAVSVHLVSWMALFLDGIAPSLLDFLGAAPLFLHRDVSLGSFFRFFFAFFFPLVFFAFSQLLSLFPFERLPFSSAQIGLCSFFVPLYFLSVFVFVVWWFILARCVPVFFFSEPPRFCKQPCLHLMDFSGLLCLGLSLCIRVFLGYAVCWYGSSLLSIFFSSSVGAFSYSLFSLPPCTWLFPFCRRRSMPRQRQHLPLLCHGFVLCLRWLIPPARFFFALFLISKLPPSFDSSPSLPDFELSEDFFRGPPPFFCRPRRLVYSVPNHRTDAVLRQTFSFPSSLRLSSRGWRFFFVGRAVFAFPFRSPGFTPSSAVPSDPWSA